MRLHASFFSCRCWREDETHVRKTYVKRTDEMFTPLTYFWPSVMLVASLSCTQNVTTKGLSTFEKIQLIVQMNVHYAYLVRFFLLTLL